MISRFAVSFRARMTAVKVLHSRGIPRSNKISFIVSLVEHEIEQISGYNAILE